VFTLSRLGRSLSLKRERQEAALSSEKMSTSDVLG
jgi:hypothetical protein